LETPANHTNTLLLYKCARSVNTIRSWTCSSELVPRQLQRAVMVGQDRTTGAPDV